MSEYTISVYPFKAVGGVPAVAGGLQPPKVAALGNTYELCVVSCSKPEKVAEIVRRFALQETLINLLPDNRIKICKRYRLPDNKVKILAPIAGGGSFYSGLMTCGQGWICPICGAKIAERKKQELIKVCTGYPYSLLFGTFTLQHKLGDSLEYSLSMLLDAFRRVMSGDAWQEIKKQYGLIGAVKYVEIRFSFRAGWHPHLHVIYFFDRLLKPGQADDLAQEVRTIYQRKLKKLGGYANNENGFVLEDVKTTADGIAEYLCKWDRLPRSQPWGVESELMMSNFKKSRGDSLSFFELVQLADLGASWAKGRIQEYAATTKGLSMLRWSNGLRDRLLLPLELSDLEIALQETEQAAEVAEISRVWHLVKSFKLRGKFLELANTNPDELLNQISILDSLL